jgi:hypothetical protein
MRIAEECALPLPIALENPQYRNPQSEIRNPQSIRIPHSEIRNTMGAC